MELQTRVAESDCLDPQKGSLCPVWTVILLAKALLQRLQGNFLRSAQLRHQTPHCRHPQPPQEDVPEAPALASTEVASVYLNSSSESKPETRSEWATPRSLAPMPYGRGHKNGSSWHHHHSQHGSDLMLGELLKGIMECFDSLKARSLVPPETLPPAAASSLGPSSLAPTSPPRAPMSEPTTSASVSALLAQVIFSFLAHMSHYDHDLWDEVANLSELVSVDKGKDVLHLMEDGREDTGLAEGIRLLIQDNILADALSSDLLDPYEWSLNHKIALDIFTCWGVPEVNFFASAANAKVPRFWSRYIKPEVSATRQAHVLQYSHKLWEGVAAFADFLLPEKVAAFERLVEDSREASRFLMHTAYDICNITVRGTATAVSMWRQTWLRGTGFSTEVQQRIQDLPFAGDLLFGEKVEATLQKTKDSKTTIKSLAPLSSGLRSFQPPQQGKKAQKCPFVPSRQLARPPSK
nr:PREDICTED: uncharacterized protein LOC106706878 [Latimeria chalumnae]|eukprot:XP_014353905.1 PREDICTED: uncharacterized protein LOC106706878 [Latimeria chalumnae]